MKEHDPIETASDTEPSEILPFRFHVVDGTQELLLISAPEITPSPSVDLRTLRAYQQHAGFECLEIDDATLIDFLRRLRAGEEFSITLGVLEPGISVELDFEESTGILFAVLKECDRPTRLSMLDLETKIENSGFKNFKINDTDLSAILTKIKQKQNGRFAIGKRPEYTKICFRFDAESNNLLAKLSASDTAHDLSPSTIEKQAHEEGFQEFYFEADAFSKICEHATKNVRGEFFLGKCKDAEIELSFDENLMVAFVSTKAPFGGKPLCRSMLDEALAKASVYRPCCDEKVIDYVLSETSVNNIEIAQGVAPKCGTDAEFEALVSEVEYTQPKETKSGKIDIREIVNFTLIDEGKPLMRRTPAKPGANGRNVKGEVILAEEVSDTPFDNDLNGVCISKEDPNLLVSTCKGHPVIQAHGVRVDNVITVNNIDMSTGNLTYDGSVLVKGEVRPGMKLIVTGDIVVKGVVSKAYLQAQNNITVECGIIGSDPAKDGNESPPAIIKAGGDISAQYITLADVSAGRDLHIREYASHCQIEAKHQILAGKSGGKGKIFGGRAYARAGVFANSLGASGDVKTSIFAGSPPEQQKQFEQLLQSHKNRTQQEDKLSAMLKKYEKALIDDPMNVKSAQKIIAIKKVLKELRQETDKMADTIKKINLVFKESRKAEIRVRKDTHPNVSLSINGATFIIRQESKGGVFVKSGNDIRWMNYTEKK